MSFLPGTAVKFIKCNKCILSGNGNELCYYENINELKSKVLLNRIKVVHGICENLGEIIAFGGYFVEFLQLRDLQLLIRQNVGLKHQEFVMDVLITKNSIDKLEFCVCLAHGTVKYYELVKSEHRISCCYTSTTNEKTLLYCCKFFKTDSMDIYKVGGTVQNCVVFWKHSSKNQSNASDILIGQTLCVLKNGHKGAIFGIDVCIERGLMVTTGDDRRLLLWKRINIDGDVMSWSIIADMYGHEARVWGTKLIRDDSSTHTDCFIATWGEDCSVRLWEVRKDSMINSLVAKQIKCRSVHRGRGIWCGDVWYNKGNCVVSVVTGGNDGALVYQQSLLSSKNSNNVQSSISMDSLIKDDFPRFLVLVDSSKAVVVSDQGNLMLANQNQSNNTLQPIRIKSESNNQSDNCCIYYDNKRHILYTGSASGLIVMYRFCCQEKDSVELLSTIKLSGKVMGFYEAPNLEGNSTDDLSNIFVALATGECVLLSDGNKVGSFRHPEKGGWFTCITGLMDYSRNVISICAGDRKGLLSQYTITMSHHAGEPSNELIGRVRVCSQKEGGITSLCQSECLCGCVYVGTKAGCVYRWNLIGSELSLVLKDSNKIGWIGGLRMICVDNKSNESALEICGFKSTMFRRLMLYPQKASVPVAPCHVSGPVSMTWEFKCGGGHREWNLIGGQDCGETQTITFSFIQQRSVNIICSTIQTADFMEEPVTIKPFLHGRQINSCFTLSNDHSDNQNSLILIGGSEDTTISTIYIHQTELLSHTTSNIGQISHFQGHVSSVRCLATYTNGLSTYLLSGGGRGQLLLWKMMSVRNGSHDTICEKLGQVMLHDLMEDNYMDIRIMGVCGFCCHSCYGDDKHFIMVAASSGHLLLLSAENNSINKSTNPIANKPLSRHFYRFKLVCQQKISGSCLTSCNYALLKTCTDTNTHNNRDNCELRLVMSSTDGHLYWMNIVVHSNAHNNSYQVHKWFIHKTSIHGDDLWLVNNSEMSRLHVLLGGDDGGVRVVAMETGDPNISQHLLAHFGSTVSTKWLPCQVENKKMKAASLGSDGYLLLWQYDYSDTLNCNLELMRVLSRDIGVTDPLCMSVCTAMLPNNSSSDDKCDRSNSCLFYVVGIGAKLSLFNI